MRLERKSLAGLALAVPVWLSSSSCCTLCTPRAPTGDVVSGEPKGSAAVKVEVTLTDAEKGCSGVVRPPKVIVLHGSVIRWRVRNDCTKAPVSYLEFTRPTPVASEKGARPAPGADPWAYAFCTPRIDLKRGADSGNVLHCEVPDQVPPGTYKYGLKGAVDVDPQIEVRKGGGGT
jgi:hypothetical protein